MEHYIQYTRMNFLLPPIVKYRHAYYNIKMYYKEDEIKWPVNISR